MYARVKRLIPILIVAIILATSIFSAYYFRNENKMLKSNQETLLDTIKSFKVSDSLNAVTTNSLMLSLKQYKKYHADDAALIKQLKGKQPELVAKTELRTENNIKVKLKDTIIYKDKYIDTLKTILYNDKWSHVSGFIANDTVSLSIANNEELLITESLQKKKFLFFWLPVSIFGYKQKALTVISKNPNTQIKSTEFITVK